MRVGLDESNPATRCNKIQQNDPSATSDYYWIQLTNGTTTQVYCEMAPRCACSSATASTSVAFVNMTDSSQQCPGEFIEVSNSRVRACGRQTTTSPGCNSATFSVLGMEYQYVCGRIVGWQIGSPDGFAGSSQGIDSYYIDGISITYGGPPREHIWSLAGIPDETFTIYNYICPCSNTGVSGVLAPPSFVGNDYYCETGRSSMGCFMRILILCGTVRAVDRPAPVVCSIIPRGSASSYHSPPQRTLRSVFVLTASLEKPDPEVRSARVLLQAYIEFCTRCRNIVVQSDYRLANYDANNCQLRIPASGSHVDVRWQLQALSDSLSTRSS